MQSAMESDNAYLEKVYCSNLRVGMYVQELDRPWLGTPFMFQGFCIRDDEGIETLQKYCEYVYINRAQEETDPKVTHARVENEQSTTSLIKTIANKAGSDSRYVDTVAVEKELETARKIYEETSRAIENVFKTAHCDGAVNLNDASKTTSSIVDSVLRNPDAFMLLQHIKSKGRYRYAHAINCCALAATICRHLGFSKAEIQNISMGALMLDIGITKLPDSLINVKGALNPLLMKLIHHHVNFGVEILDNTPDLPSLVRDMVLTHHERINGKGYPNGMKGEQIPVCGRIAAIVDCYDALISNRPHKKSISQSEAICAMYNWRNIDFNEDLIEQFIQCIGAYPTGSLVELNTGQVGIVMSQNRVRRLYPKILVILSADRIRYENPSMIDLWEYAQKAKGTVLDIKKIVDADELDFDPSDYYL
ncbi:MAG: HD-GYP domain-containing protein [Pseudomonadota bacterium]|nr:HD-GYP domain-containing protein [Pseudomonadota bacterium]